MTPTWTRRALGAVLAIIAVNAFAGGYYGMAGAAGVPTRWLAGSPFSSYLVPSAILFVVVGGACLVAAIAVIARWRWAGAAAIGAGLVLGGWIAIQVAIIGYVSWLQPAMLGATVVILALARCLAVTRRVTCGAAGALHS